MCCLLFTAYEACYVNDVVFKLNVWENNFIDIAPKSVMEIATE